MFIMIIVPTPGHISKHTYLQLELKPFFAISTITISECYRDRDIDDSCDNETIIYKDHGLAMMVQNKYIQNTATILEVLLEAFP